MKQEVLFIILNEYADWESAFLAASLHSGLMPGSEIKYVVKTVAPTLEAVRSLGGFRTLPDYSFDTPQIRNRPHKMTQRSKTYRSRVRRATPSSKFRNIQTG